MTAERVLRYEPAGPVLKTFHESDAFVRGILGPVGSGKSTACVVEVLRRARQQEPGPDGVRRVRVAVIRNTFPELTTTTVKTWEQWIPREYGRFRNESPIVHHVLAGDLDMEVLFLALDVEGDVRKLLSLEITFSWINEAREIARSIVDVLTTRVGRFPAARDGGCTWSGIIMDTNAPDTEHWWYKLAEEQRPSGWAFFRQPSGLSEAAENLHNLNQTTATAKLPTDDPQRRSRGRAYYERLAAGKSEDWLRVYAHGEYGLSFDGKAVFPEYSDTAHVARERLVATKGQAVQVGIDFGLTPAAVFLQRDIRGRWLVVAELVAEDMGIENFARLIKSEIAQRFADCPVNITADPAGMQRSQVDERTPIQLLNTQQLFTTAAPTNDLLVRLEAVRRLLSRLVDGRPALLLSPSCTTLRKGLAGGYCYRRMRVSGTERFHDVPDKNTFSHVADALQYALLGGGEDPTISVAPLYPTQPVAARTEWRPEDVFSNPPRLGPPARVYVLPPSRMAEGVRGEISLLLSEREAAEARGPDGKRAVDRINRRLGEARLRLAKFES